MASALSGYGLRVPNTQHTEYFDTEMRKCIERGEAQKLVLLISMTGAGKLLAIA